jgi:predicted amidohydrolase
VAFAGGSVLAAETGNIFNRAQVIDAAGRYVSSYDKVHLFRLMEEDKYLAPGTSASLFELGAMTCASVICYDIRFCELPRKLAVQGAELLFVSAEWPSPRVEHWRTLLRARAIENQLFVAACNRGGVTDGEVFAGNSMLVAPDGTVLAEAGTGEEIIWADFEPELVRQVRKQIPVFEDRAPELY